MRACYIAHDRPSVTCTPNLYFVPSLRFPKGYKHPPIFKFLLIAENTTFRGSNGVQFLTRQLSCDAEAVGLPAHIMPGGLRLRLQLTTSNSKNNYITALKASIHDSQLQKKRLFRPPHLYDIFAAGLFLTLAELEGGPVYNGT